MAIVKKGISWLRVPPEEDAPPGVKALNDKAVEKLEPWEFDRIYGGWWGQIVEHDGKNAVRRSAGRYIAAIEE